MDDSNPLIRALALRTISYIHVREFVEATVQPTKHLMGDPDPYVRKTAAFSVAKLYEHDKLMVERSDLIDRLNRMLKDENPTVVSSVLASLVDIWGRSESISLTIDYPSASKLVSILPDCSEYGIRFHYETPARWYDTFTDEFFSRHSIGGARRTSWKLSCHMSLRSLQKHYY